MAFSNPTNNLDDCRTGMGLVLDGEFFLTIVATEPQLTESINGMLEVARVGSGGGLVPLNSCFLRLRFSLPDRALTGTVCGRSVNRTL